MWQSALAQPSISRRAALQAGMLTFLGLNNDRLRRLQAASATTETKPKQRAHSCVFIFLFGGQSHIDLWDMKPDAPREIRGEFLPIETNVGGVRICEHLPLMAKQMDKVCLVRSMSHKMPVHGPACSEIYSGREYFGPPVTDQATPKDWPSLSSMVNRFGRKKDAGLPTSVVLPWYTQFVGQDRRIAGQTGARMGEEFNPFLIAGNPNSTHFEVQGLSGGATLPQLKQRERLQKSLEALAEDRIPDSANIESLQRHYRTAYSMIRSSIMADALQLDRETESLRDHYGRTRFGQSLLLSRRLVESGVNLVTVNWDDDHKDDKVSPHWDTHVDNFPKLKSRLCPPFDRGLSAFLEDLDQRGLLETTLVVALGEFGRTPKVGAISQNGMTTPTGRDHWPHAFSAIVAGGGVPGGQVYGSTTRTGGYVKDRPASPADLAATVFEHLGIDPTLEYEDRFMQIPQQLCVGEPLQLA
ncbi:MAG: DUF1501 domain-containing protein [Planctomycetaceae bacterium]|nr:DUF1501 domain-containing protein [Planctomycetaceae bacterium]